MHNEASSTPNAPPPETIRSTVTFGLELGNYVEDIGVDFDGLTQLERDLGYTDQEIIGTRLHFAAILPHFYRGVYVADTVSVAVFSLGDKNAVLAHELKHRHDDALGLIGTREHVLQAVAASLRELGSVSLGLGVAVEAIELKVNHELVLGLGGIALGAGAASLAAGHTIYRLIPEERRAQRAVEEVGERQIVQITYKSPQQIAAVVAKQAYRLLPIS